MANLKAEEFSKIIEFLAEDHGLQAFRDKLVRLNALVTRRRAGKVANLANQLYTLTGGLRRDVPATIAIHTLWGEKVNEGLDEKLEKGLEKTAEQINECLGDRDRIIEEKSEEIAGYIRQYELLLASGIGPDRARIDMVMKAVPDVADKLREMDPVTAADAAAAREAMPDPDESEASDDQEAGEDAQ